MSPEYGRMKAAFLEAVHNVPREEWDSYLDEACDGDPTLRSELQELLAAHVSEGSLASPAIAATIEAPAERVGAQVGPYKLREQIGEGGMGVVYVAEQTEPVRRRVALKIIKPGMDSRQVIARFEAERQALALMDHPNIARVLDAGATETGRPYFVMELVRGVPITEFCDKAKLDTRRRLELFVQVCQAVQHAHQKGIIHRDLKPSNVLVTMIDGKPVPKVIDFGVAKATSQQLTERTIYTQFAQMVGTPLYMSPEQAEMSGQDIDTRSDVYSLGVLLYELLTGSTPFDRDKLRTAAFDEVRRIIREDEPQRPSARVSTLAAAALSTVSEQRGIDPRKLSHQLRGELDWIVMKAIEKNRSRRYESASALAADLERFLRDEPIVARSPSLRYRFAKFARRNRAAMLTSAVLSVSLLLGVVAMSSLLYRTTHTLRRLVAASYGEAVAGALAGDQERARTALEMMHAAGGPEDRVNVLNGFIALSTGRFSEAAKIASQMLNHPSTGQTSQRVAALSLLATASTWEGYFDRAERHLHELHQLSATTETEYLLKVSAVVNSDPQGALELLHARPRMLHSPAGLLIRGQCNLLNAIDRQDADLLEKALQDFEYVEFLFHDQRIAAWRIWAFACAIQLARGEGRAQDVIRYSREGRTLLEKPPLAHDYPRWLFYRTVGDTDHAAHALRALGGHPSGHCWLLAADCLRRHDGPAALHEFDDAISDNDRTSKYVRIARAHLLRGSTQGAKRSATSWETCRPIRHHLSLAMRSPPYVLRVTLWRFRCTPAEPSTQYQRSTTSMRGGHVWSSLQGPSTNEHS